MVRPHILLIAIISPRRRGGLMVSVHDSGSSGPGSSPGRGHCVVFSGRTLQSSFYAFCGINFS